MKLTIKVLVFVVIIAKLSESAKILAIFPTPSISHQVVFRALTQALAARGHELTILTPDPVNQNNPNVTEIDLSSSYKTFKKLFSYGALKSVLKDEIGFIREASIIFETLMNEQLNNPEVKKLINEPEKYNFDIMIIEQTGYIPMLAFAEIYDLPVIGITSFEAPGFTYQMFGNEANPVIHPEQNFPFAHGELTFEQRWKSLKSLFKAIISLVIPPSPVVRLNNVYKTHFPKIDTSLFDLLERVELFMVNTHPALGFVRPLVPTTVQLGFMHIEEPKEIAGGNLKTFIEKSINGVIYISFGSNIASEDFDESFIETIKNVIKSSEYDFVWKLEEKFKDKPSNLFLSNWLPQADLLAHSNVKLFVTQAGQQSIEEAVDREVPMITIPFLGDQPGVAKKLEQKGVAYLIEPEDLTEKGFELAIREMMKPFYKENIKRLKKQVYDQPMTSREKAVWWVEFFIRHKGTKHLYYPGRMVPFYQKYCLDFIAIFLALIFIVKKVLKLIFNKIFLRKIKIE